MNEANLRLSTEGPIRGHGRPHEDSLELQVISDSDDLPRLGRAWDRLLAQLREPAPFATHAWISSWWDCFGGDNELHLVLAWRGQHLCGIAPLMLGRVTWYGVPLRRLGCLYNSHVQRMSFPVLDACRDAFHKALWQHVQEIGARWDVLELNQFDEASPTLQAIEAQAREAGLRHAYWQQGVSPFLALPDDWDVYLAGLSANRRGTLRRKLRRLSDEGEVRMERLCTGPDIEEALRDGFHIESLAWKAQQGTAILSDPVVLRLYDDLARRLAEKRGLALYFLTVDGKRIAFHYCVEEGSAIFLLKPGYDPAWSRYSPSELLTWLVLEQAVADGKSEYDFLGDSDAWKLKWANGGRSHHWLYVFSPSLRGRLLHAMKTRLIPGLKAVAGRLRRGP